MSLAKALDIPEDALLEMASNADKYYFQNKAITKPNGKKRITYSVNDPLKTLHQLSFSY